MKVTIDRELLERAASMELDTTARSIHIQDEIRAILAQPTQQSEAVEVVGYAVLRDGDESFPWLCKTVRIAHSAAAQVTLPPKASVEPLMTVAQHQRILAASVAT